MMLHSFVSSTLAAQSKHWSRTRESPLKWLFRNYPCPWILCCKSEKNKEVLPKKSPSAETITIHSSQMCFCKMSENKLFNSFWSNVFFFFQITYPVSQDQNYLQLNKKTKPFLDECLNDQLSTQGTVLMKTCHFSPPRLVFSPVAASTNVCWGEGHNRD